MSMSPPAGSDERDRKRPKIALLVGVPAVIITMAITLLPALLIVADAYDWDGSRADATALRKPFAAAVADLRFSEGVVYGDAKYAGMSISDITVTRSGMRLGVLDFQGGGPLDGIELPGTGSGADLGAIELLQVDEKTFFRAHGTKMPWTTGSMVDDVGPMLETFWTPSRLAEHLGALLANAGEDDLVGEGAVPSVESIGDQPVLRADLGGNSLLVSKSEPHRIVAVIPRPVIQGKWIQKSASQPRAPVGGPDDLALVAWSSSDGDKPAFGDDGMSVDPVPAENADSMYDQFEEPINELPNAVNSDISFNLSPSGNVSCSTGGCTVNQQIVGSVNSTSPDAQVSGGQVTANMVTTFTIDGGGAGSCTASGTFPVTGDSVSGSLSCSNPGAGPIMAAAIQRKKAALGPRGGRYQVAYSAQTNVTARAVVGLWVKKAKAALDNDRQRARKAAGGGGALAKNDPVLAARNAPGSPLAKVPPGASMRKLKPHPGAGSQNGVEFKFPGPNGTTTRIRVHDADGTAPAGSNAASGPTYRIQVGGRYMDAQGNLYPRNVHNPNSPHYDPEAANATHIPWPPDVPLPW